MENRNIQDRLAVMWYVTIAIDERRSKHNM